MALGPIDDRGTFAAALAECLNRLRTEYPAMANKYQYPVTNTSLQNEGLAIINLSEEMIAYFAETGGSGGSGTSVPTSVSVSPVLPAMTAPGQTLQFTAVVLDQNGVVLAPGVNGVPALIWSSSNTTAATVNASTGLATEVGNGSTVITATCGIRGGGTTVTCSGASTPVPTTVTISPASASLGASGATQQFTAVVLDQNSNPMTPGVGGVPALVWSSLNTASATINTATGLATEVGNGSTTIKCMCGSAGNTATLTTTGSAGGGGGTGSPGNNLPSGMTVVVNTGDMTATPATLGQNGGGSGFVWSVTGPTGIVTQFTNESPQTVSGTGEWSGNITIGTSGHGLRMLYPNNLAGGNSPARWRIGWSNAGTGKLYIAFLFRFSSGWNFSQASGIKMLEPLSVVSGNNDYFGWNCQNSSGNKDSVSAWPFFGIQGNHTNDLPGAPQGFPAPTSVYKGLFANIGSSGPTPPPAQRIVELYIQPESPLNSGLNGQLTFWIDNQLAWTSVGQAAGGGTGVPSAGITFDSNGYDAINSDPTYGGDASSDHPPSGAQPMYWEINNLFVAVG